MNSKRKRQRVRAALTSRSRRSRWRRLAVEELEARLVLALTLDLGVSSLLEGQAASTALVTRVDGNIAAPLTVNLSSSDASEATVPTTVTIPANQLSAQFTVTAIADGLVDDAVMVTLTAAASGHANAQDGLTVANADVLRLRPGAAADEIRLTPAAQVGRFDVGGATPAEWAPPIVDLSIPTLADQRTSLSLSTGSPYRNATSLIKVNPAERYTVYAVTQTGVTSPDEHPLGYLSLDVDQRVIELIHVARYAFAADTTLAATLNPGDMSILIDNASGWSNDAWDSADTRSLAWYGYADSTGHVYPNYSYTRNVAQGSGDGLWAPGGISYDASAGAYRIDLVDPWSGPTIAAGAAIRNAAAGATYALPQVDETVAGGGASAAFSATIGGGVWQNGMSSGIAFRPGTAFIQPAVVTSAPWSGLAIAPEQDAINFGPLDFSRPVVEANGLREIVLDFDPLAKSVFGAGASVVIDSVTPPQQGAASIAPGPAGRDVIRYRSTPGFVGTVVVGYTLRNSATGDMFTGQVTVTIEDNADAMRLEKLRSLAIGMLNYESAQGRFPLAANAAHFDSSGNPYLSWRVHLLPFLGHQSLYNQFHLNEPWNSAHNLPLAAQMPEEFRDPAADASATVTRFRIVSGEGTNYYWRRSNGLLVGPTDNEINAQDGLPHTLLVVETGADAAITWTRPDLPNFNSAAPLASLGTLTSGRINAVMADGRPITLPASINPAVFASLVTIAGGEIVDANTLRREYAESQGPDAVEAFGASVADYYFKVIALGMHNHHDAQARFPVAGSTSRFDSSGNPKLSWRVHILPYMGYQNLYEQFHLDEAWDSAHNLPLLAEMPDVFRSAADESDSTSTRVMTFIGPQAPFGYRTAGSTQLGPRAVDIVDGFTNTIMFVEAGTNVAVPWTKPDDLPLEVANPFAGLGNLPNGELRATMFDITLLSFSENLPPATLAALATRAGGEPVDAAANALGGSVSVIDNLKDVAVAMLNYEDARGRFPANRFASDGTPLLSWRVEILPYLGLTGLYNQFHRNEPWDSPHNLALLDFMPSVYRSVDAALDAATTRVATFTGAGAPFPAVGTNTTVGPRWQDVTDGSSNTFMIVEAGSDRAVPWTKPVDVPYHTNNPYSALGDLGEEFLAAFFNGAVIPQSSSMAISALSARITHQGGGSSDAPNPTPYLHQSHGDSRIGEFGADWFDVVFDAPPSTPTTLMLSVSDPAALALDRQSLTFNATNWSVPQRVVLRAIDNSEVNEDRALLVTVGSQTIAVTVVNDDHEPPSADFDGSGAIDGADFLRWQRGFGIIDAATRTDGDANGDGRVDVNDLAAWKEAFGQTDDAPLTAFMASASLSRAGQAASHAPLWPTIRGVPTSWIDAAQGSDGFGAAKRGLARAQFESRYAGYAAPESFYAATDAAFATIGASSFQERVKKLADLQGELRIASEASKQAVAALPFERMADASA